MKQKAKQGGKRSGAGRPRKFPHFTEPTTSIRVPKSVAGEVEKFFGSNIQIPLFASRAPAGLASPADDWVETSFTVKELVDYFMQRPSSTFLVRISGWSMKNAGINDGAIVICDRALEAVSGDVVIASVDGQVTCKRLISNKSGAILAPENDAFRPTVVSALSDFRIWGVVTGNFNLHRRAKP